ncbi:MAG TPA: hypothetical protein VN132_03110, partial [Bdellovibrio sp.]|nr:hypothetical protein [Bdellovibrio sp.]
NLRASHNSQSYLDINHSAGHILNSFKKSKLIPCNYITRVQQEIFTTSNHRYLLILSHFDLFDNSSPSNRK